MRECLRCLHGIVVLPANKDIIALTNTQYFAIPDLDFNYEGRFHRPYLSPCANFLQWLVNKEPENLCMQGCYVQNILVTDHGEVTVMWRLEWQPQ